MTDAPVAIDTLSERIHLVRGQRVMLDADLAELYGVATKVLNQAITGLSNASRQLTSAPQGRGVNRQEMLNGSGSRWQNACRIQRRAARKDSTP